MAEALNTALTGAAAAMLCVAVVLLGLWWILRQLGIFRGFWPAFWIGLFFRLFVGSLRGDRGDGVLRSFMLAVGVMVLGPLLALIVLALAIAATQLW